MRRTTSLLVLCFSSWLLLACQASDGSPGAELEVAQPGGETPRTLVAQWVEMWNAYDLDRVAELFLNDPRLTYFSSEFEGVIRGFPAIVEHHRGFGFVPGGQDGGARLWVEDLTEDRFGEAAVLTGIWFFQRGTEGGDDPTPSLQRGPVTFVCARSDGEWRFVHMTFGTYTDPNPREGG